MAAVQYDGNMMSFSATDFVENGVELSIADVRDGFRITVVGFGGVTIHGAQGFDGAPAQSFRRKRGMVHATINCAVSSVIDYDIVTVMYLGIRREIKKCANDVGTNGLEDAGRITRLRTEEELDMIFRDTHVCR